MGGIGLLATHDVPRSALRRRVCEDVSGLRDPNELRAPTSQDSPLPLATGVAFLALLEPLARRFPMTVVGESLRPQPPSRAIERTDLIARTAIEPDFVSVGWVGGGMEIAAPIRGEGAGEAALLRA
jgi:hypothetical protein